MGKYYSRESPVKNNHLAFPQFHIYWDLVNTYIVELYRFAERIKTKQGDLDDEWEITAT